MAKIIGLVVLVMLVVGGIYIGITQNNSLFKKPNTPTVKPIAQNVTPKVTPVTVKITPTPRDSDIAQYQKLSEEDNLASMDGELKSLDNLEKDFDTNLKQI